MERSRSIGEAHQEPDVLGEQGDSHGLLEGRNR